MKSHLYRGQFNWYGEIFVIWKHAANWQKAFFLMIKEIAKTLGINEYRVRIYFNGNEDNYKIERKRKNERPESD